MIRKRVSIKNAVLNFTEDTGLSATSMDETLKRWARDGDLKIGSFYSYSRKLFVLDVCGCTVKLPCEAVAVLGALYGDHGTCCENLFDQVYLHRHGNPAYGFFLYGVDNFGGRCVPRMKYEIEDNSLVFLNGSGLTDKITVQLLVYETDEDGFIRVNENHVDALSKYMQMMMARRYRWDPKKQYNAVVKALPDLRTEWHVACRNARAEDSEASETDKAEIVSLFNDPYSGYKEALWVGGHNIYSNYL